LNEISLTIFHLTLYGVYMNLVKLLIPEINSYNLKITIRRVILALLAIFIITPVMGAQKHLPEMVSIPGGSFLMGSEDMQARADEGPVHSVSVDSFSISRTEITNGQFQTFVDETGYVTTAELIPDYDEIRAGLPPGSTPPPKEALVPGSMVFVPTDGPVPLNNVAQWWRFIPGADWKHPLGPDSSIGGLENLPVVHMSWYDASAYAEWAGGRLPTEAEWEYAARGGRSQEPFSWGSETLDEGIIKANTWTGTFPYLNDGKDGSYLASQVATFQPNDYGLYDMAGNVWEWTADWYNAEAYAINSGEIVKNFSTGDPETLCYDPAEPWAQKRSLRGGSFLCHESYCEGYRVTNRMKSTPDTSLVHTGFRIVKDE
jgi:sulfatase modifying factor 1